MNNTIEVGDRLIAKDTSSEIVRKITHDKNRHTDKILIDIYFSNGQVETIELYKDEIDYILVKGFDNCY